MISLKLAEQLKEAGFPKKVIEYEICEKCRRPVPPISNAGYPTLDELIEACGDKLDLIERGVHERWRAQQTQDSMKDCIPDCCGYEEASTIEEAVAKLWLKMKNDEND